MVPPDGVDTSRKATWLDPTRHLRRLTSEPRLDSQGIDWYTAARGELELLAGGLEVEFAEVESAEVEVLDPQGEHFTSANARVEEQC